MRFIAACNSSARSSVTVEPNLKRLAIIPPTSSLSGVAIIFCIGWGGQRPDRTLSSRHLPGWKEERRAQEDHRYFAAVLNVCSSAICCSQMFAETLRGYWLCQKGRLFSERGGVMISNRITYFSCFFVCSLLNWVILCYGLLLLKWITVRSHISHFTFEIFYVT